MPAEKGENKANTGFGYILWPLLGATLLLYLFIAYLVLSGDPLANDRQNNQIEDVDDVNAHERHHSLDSLVMEGLPPHRRIRTKAFEESGHLRGPG